VLFNDALKKSSCFCSGNPNKLSSVASGKDPNPLSSSFDLEELDRRDDPKSSNPDRADLLDDPLLTFDGLCDDPLECLDDRDEYPLLE
jgi:hypothetical protein